VQAVGNSTGQRFDVFSYEESSDSTFKAVGEGGASGPWDGKAMSEPYPVLDRLTRQRILARTTEATFVHDYVDLFAGL